MKSTYTFIFLVSLLIILVHSASSSRSSSHGENPLSFLLLGSSTTIREQQKDRATNQLASLQAYHQHNIQTLVRQVQQRHLQSNTTTNATTPTFAPTTASTPPPAPTTCNATTGLVNFNDDDINANLFGTAANIYDSSCFCEEETNSNEVGAILGQLDPLNVTAFVEGFNTAVGELFLFSNYSCMTQCEACFASLDTTTTTQVCGLFSVEDSTRVENKKGNFTWEEIFAINEADWNELVDTAEFSRKNCVQYTGDAYGNSEVCYSADVMSLAFDKPLYCNITYNDVLCSSCIISDVTTNANSTSNSTGTTEEGCLIADCTNVDATYGTMIDLCQNTGLTGPFQILSLPDIVTDTTFTPGTCDGDAVPEATPTVQTTTSPVVVTSPSSNTTDMPTTAPVLVNGPAPTKSNTTNTTTTKTPVRAPATTPVLPAPTTSDATRTLSMTFSMSFLVGLWTLSCFVLR